MFRSEDAVRRLQDDLCGSRSLDDLREWAQAGLTAVDAFSVKEDGQIYFEGGTNTKLAKETKVGVVKDNKLRTINPIEGSNVDDISMQKAGDFLIYNQIAGVPGATPDYSLMAIMKKDPSAATKP